MTGCEPYFRGGTCFAVLAFIVLFSLAVGSSTAGAPPGILLDVEPGRSLTGSSAGWNATSRGGEGGIPAAQAHYSPYDDPGSYGPMMKDPPVMVIHADRLQPGIYVVEGGSLWLAAMFLYGDPYLWREIWYANQGRMGNPNELPAGALLDAPGVADIPVVDLLGVQSGRNRRISQSLAHGSSQALSPRSTALYAGRSGPSADSRVDAWAVSPGGRNGAEWRESYTFPGFSWSAPIDGGPDSLSRSSHGSSQTIPGGRRRGPGTAGADSPGRSSRRFNSYMPLNTGTITSGFGYRPVPAGLSHRRGQRREFHTGIDIGAPRGTAIYSTGDGVVEFAGWSNGYGNLVKVRHPNGAVTYYGHCRSINVRRGQQVRAGQIIATVNSTGRSTGDHLHFEIRVNGRPVDPRRYFRFPGVGGRI